MWDDEVVCDGVYSEDELLNKIREKLDLHKYKYRLVCNETSTSITITGFEISAEYETLVNLIKKWGSNESVPLLGSSKVRSIRAKFPTVDTIPKYIYRSVQMEAVYTFARKNTYSAEEVERHTSGIVGRVISSDVLEKFWFDSLIGIS